MPSLYRPRDGWFVRRFFFVLSAAFGAFGAYRTYIWARGWTWPLSRIPIEYALNWGQVGSALILVFASAFSVYVMFMNRRSVDFLVEVERELREVAWPEYQPIGSPKAELWGSTYIVIVVVVIMTAFTGLVDMIYQTLAQFVFYR